MWRLVAGLVVAVALLNPAGGARLVSAAFDPHLFTLDVSAYPARAVIAHAHGAPTAPRIRSAVLARGYANGQAVGVTRSFHPTDNPLHCVIHLGAISAVTKLRVVWVAVNAGGVHNYKIAEKTFTLHRAVDTTVNATLSLPRKWPVGTYKVVLYLNGRVARTIGFSIR
jgi:hypothetical protein